MMKKLFYSGIFFGCLFEFLNVYFIMPMPGSQPLNILNAAYLLHSYRWIFRGIYLILLFIGISSAFKTKQKWIPSIGILLLTGLIILFNFKLNADAMFLEPEVVHFTDKNSGLINDSTVVLATTINGEAKAYPIRYLIYHHQVQDEVGGKPVLVTYCSVCRTGRMFEPKVNGKQERFRLVGMNGFNAMFEDLTTRSWWRQVNGEAITGPLKGTFLPELESRQMSARMFFTDYPEGLVMLPDSAFMEKYDTLGRYEKGLSNSSLTRTDSVSWKDKSWIVGVLVENQSFAFDWIALKKQRVLTHTLLENQIVVVLATDEKTFSAFLVDRNSNPILRGDTLVLAEMKFSPEGKSYSGGEPLKRLRSYQEFWHSWRMFQPMSKVIK